jgi:hypothetical protein
VAFLNHFQREEKLFAKLFLAAAEIRLRHQRAQRAVRKFCRAVVGLPAPDRQHDRARHAETLLDRAERFLMLGGQRAPLRGQIGK